MPNHLPGPPPPKGVGFFPDGPMRQHIGWTEEDFIAWKPNEGILGKVTIAHWDNDDRCSYEVEKKGPLLGDTSYSWTDDLYEAAELLLLP